MASLPAFVKAVEKISMQPVASLQIKLNLCFAHLPGNQASLMSSGNIRNKFYFIIPGLMLSFSGLAQKTTHGIVVDSTTLSALQGVHVKIKNTGQGTVTDSKGEFYISTRPADTLLLSRVGYVDLLLPLLFEEEDILIRLKERVRMLKEITIRSTRLGPEEVTRSVRTAPRKMSTADAFSSPWDYFTKGQKDRRKTVKLINENNRIKTYVEVIHDQLLREEIMDELELSETEYYGILAEFNKQNRDLLYSTDKIQIITSLKSFFRAFKR